jgi:signal transduction histidine kinase
MKKINFSLSLKLTIIVISVSAITIASIGLVNLYFFNIHYENIFFENPYYETASSYVQALNSTIGDNNSLLNKEILSNKTDDFLSAIPSDYRDNILKITVNLADVNDDLYVFYSTDNSTIGETSEPYLRVTDKESIECNNKAYKQDYIYFISDHKMNHHNLIMLSPINISGELFGTYELVLSMNDAYNRFDQELESQIKWTVIISVICLFFLIFSFLYFLSRTVVKPLKTFRDSAKIIGKGNLDTSVKIKSNDELGELATAFNEMAIDLKESRDKIHEYNKILENLLKQKDEFIGQLGHDLKNPLQPLVGLLPILIEQEKDPKIKEGLEIMNNNVEYMRNLILKTLQLAKLRSSDIKFDIERVNLKNLIDEVVISQKHQLEENNIKIENHIKNNIFVQADILRITELFNNLISNASKYTTDEKGKIIIDAKIKEEFVEISLSDNGIGMSKETLRKIFDEFYRAYKSTKTSDSVGLGLSICKRIVEKHGGKIWASSPGVNMGSTFYFTLKISYEK